MTDQLKLLEVRRPIFWGEMDAFGHLNNVHYFRYFEDARIAFLGQFNFFEIKLYSVILKNECEYRRPVVYPDTLTTRCYVTHVGNTSFTLLYEVWSEQQQQRVAVGKSVVVIVAPENFKKQAIPDSLKTRLLAYMAQFQYLE
ncbi:MAG: thioesterase family protein [Acinetobacter sp.]